MYKHLKETGFKESPNVKFKTLFVWCRISPLLLLPSLSDKWVKFLSEQCLLCPSDSINWQKILSTKPNRFSLGGRSLKGDAHQRLKYFCVVEVNLCLWYFIYCLAPVSKMEHFRPLFLYFDIFNKVSIQ